MPVGCEPVFRFTDPEKAPRNLPNTYQSRGSRAKCLQDAFLEQMKGHATPAYGTKEWIGDESTILRPQKVQCIVCVQRRELQHGFAQLLLLPRLRNNCNFALQVRRPRRLRKQRANTTAQVRLLVL